MKGFSILRSQGTEKGSTGHEGYASRETGPLPFDFFFQGLNVFQLEQFLKTGRQVSIDRQTALDPQDRLHGQWEVCLFDSKYY